MSCFLPERLLRFFCRRVSVWTHCAHAGLLRKPFLLEGPVPRGWVGCSPGDGPAEERPAVALALPRHPPQPPCLDFALLRVVWPWGQLRPPGASSCA